MLLRYGYAKKPVGEFGNWLAESMDEKNMSQADLAELIRKSQATISGWIRERAKPSYSTVIVLSIIFNDDFDLIWAKVERDWA